MAIITPEPVKDKRSQKPTLRQARFAFGVLFTINVLNYADRYVLSAILPKIKHDFSLTDFRGGMLISAFLLVFAFTALPLGVWADKGVRKNIIALCVGTWSLATIFAGLTSRVTQLFFARSILGIGEAGYGPASVSLLGDYFPREKRGRILSYWSVGTLIGAALGVAVGGRVADVYGWRAAFFVVGVPGLLAALLAWRMLEPRRGSFDEEEGQQGQEDPIASEHAGIGSMAGQNFLFTVKHLLRIRTYWVLLGALTFSFFAIGGTSFWLPSYLVREFKLSVSRAGLLSGVVLIVSGLVGTLVGGWLADYMQRHRPDGRLFTAMIGLLMGAPLVMLALLTHKLFWFVLVFTLAGISLNFCTGPLNAVLQDVVRPTMRAVAVGLSLLIAHVLGDAAAPTVIGSLSDKYRLDVALLITTPTFLFLAGFVCLLGLHSVDRDMRRMRKQNILTGASR